MATNDEQVARGGKKVIDLNIGYPSEECSSHECSGIDFSTDTELDMIRDDIIEDDNVLRGDQNPNECNGISLYEPTPTTIKEPLVPPSVGMTFGSYEEIISYYHEFGRQNGFQMKIRSRENVKGIDSGNGNDCTRLRLACTKEGKFNSREKDPSKAAHTQITGCKAKITASVDKNASRWKLTTIILEHNHPLDPLNSRFMSNYRFISPHNKKIIMTNERAGVPISRNYATFVVRYGGFGAVPFSEKYCRNLVSKHRRLCLQEGNFAATEKHFIEMSSKDKDFYYMYDTDDDGTLKNIFWADGRCRAAYRDFGDVISFDTTYLRNRYKMPFFPIIGVNHHNQSILLGCALISGVDTINYVWLLKTWLACMSGKAPNCIIIDQCMAIGNAIKEVFPNTKLRWCIWHILRNAKKHLNFHEARDDIRKALKRALHDSLHVEEFEKNYGDMLVKYKLEDVNWFNDMYVLRHR
ncbi:protein FAR1-RELATED SEQUENCE 8-like [Beta vulgaris subsp. vulgaris]|uniref:protein FAR1-RELATED SEQUENCE 8-like n=1 Tax=Beta vulgaris subsp. vulgaris TaxID=3555 RepID=UPI0020372D8A|nr:protein FAR1-RELATED SEQUENCE 8-like [Beta vulgaris subsp. vulgaris]